MAITMVERQEDGAYHQVTSREGLVLGIYEQNMRDDSDFHAIYWNPEKKEPRDIVYATTRGWTYDNHATVDATPEVWSEFHGFLAGRLKALIFDDIWREARAITVGRQVIVVKGRKVSKGVKGRVFWEREDSYNPGKRRIGIEPNAPEIRVMDKMPDERVFISSENVEIDPEYLFDYVDYDRIAKADEQAKAEAITGGVARYRGLSAVAMTAPY